MAKISNHLPPNPLFTLYHSLVHVHSIYAQSVWATTFPTYLIKLKRLYFTYSNDIFEYSTRNSAIYNFYLSQFSSDRSQRSIKYVGAKIWNNIPDRFKQFSYPKFKFFYKQCL